MHRFLAKITLLTFAFIAVGHVSVVAVADIDLSQLDVNQLRENLPPGLANLNFTLDDAKTLVRDKCIQVSGDKAAGEAAFTEIENAVMTLSECATNLLNFTSLQEEIKESGPKGELDVVFNKYCNKQPEALTCAEAFNSKLSACLDKEEKEHQDVFMRIVRSLLSFICHKGGDQIALFIAEEGPECLQSKQNDIQNCVNSTFASYIPQHSGLDQFKTLPKFVLGQKQCEEMAVLEKCIVEKLETCKEITPANIVESMFRFIKNETICHNTPRVAKQESMQAGSGGGGLFVIQQQLNGMLLGLLIVSLFYQLKK